MYIGQTMSTLWIIQQQQCFFGYVNVVILDISSTKVSVEKSEAALIFVKV